MFGLLPISPYPPDRVNRSRDDARARSRRGSARPSGRRLRESLPELPAPDRRPTDRSLQADYVSTRSRRVRGQGLMAWAIQQYLDHEELLDTDVLPMYIDFLI